MSLAPDRQWPSSMSGRDAFRAPGWWNLDLGVYKDTKITERIQPAAARETFNVFNHANLYVTGSSADVGSGNAVTACYGCTGLRMTAVICSWGRRSSSDGFGSGISGWLSDGGGQPVVSSASRSIQGRCVHRYYSGWEAMVTCQEAAHDVSKPMNPAILARESQYGSLVINLAQTRRVITLDRQACRSKPFAVIIARNGILP